VRARLIAWTARAVRFTHLVDLAYRRFDRARSIAVLSLASDELLERYNELTFSAIDDYRPDSKSFRRGLFDWEAEVVARHFPPPPARILVGGAGGGREAFALLEKGYEVVAFDPAERLVRSMAAAPEARSGKLRVYCGGYESLPRLRAADDSTPGIDLQQEAPFDAAIVGWTSISHLRSDRARVETLRHFGNLTRGPILVSYHGDPAATETPPPSGRLRRWVWNRMRRRGPSVFSVQIGYYRVLRPADLERMVREAGLRLLAAEARGNWPYVVVRRVP
jgi:hypothetical protein